jgi:hypothetical protein
MVKSHWCRPRVVYSEDDRRSFISRIFYRPSIVSWSTAQAFLTIPGQGRWRGWVHVFSGLAVVGKFELFSLLIPLGSVPWEQPRGFLWEASASMWGCVRARECRESEWMDLSDRSFRIRVKLQNWPNKWWHYATQRRRYIVLSRALLWIKFPVMAL